MPIDYEADIAALDQQAAASTQPEWEARQRGVVGQVGVGLGRAALGLVELPLEAASAIPGVRDYAEPAAHYVESLKPLSSGKALEQGVELGATGLGLAGLGLLTGPTVATVGTGALFGGSTYASTRNKLEQLNQTLQAQGQEPLSDAQLQLASLGAGVLMGAGQAVIGEYLGHLAREGTTAAKTAILTKLLPAGAEAYLAKVPGNRLAQQYVEAALRDVPTFGGVAAGTAALERGVLGDKRTQALEQAGVRLPTPGEAAASQVAPAAVAAGTQVGGLALAERLFRPRPPRTPMSTPGATTASTATAASTPPAPPVTNATGAFPGVPGLAGRAVPPVAPPEAPAPAEAVPPPARPAFAGIPGLGGRAVVPEAAAQEAPPHPQTQALASDILQALQANPYNQDAVDVAHAFLQETAAEPATAGVRQQVQQALQFATDAGIQPTPSRVQVQATEPTAAVPPVPEAAEAPPAPTPPPAAPAAPQAPAPQPEAVAPPQAPAAAAPVPEAAPAPVPQEAPVAPLAPEAQVPGVTPAETATEGTTPTAPAQTAGEQIVTQLEARLQAAQQAREAQIARLLPGVQVEMPGGQRGTVERANDFLVTIRFPDGSLQTIMGGARGDIRVIEPSSTTGQVPGVPPAETPPPGPSLTRGTSVTFETEDAQYTGVLLDDVTPGTSTVTVYVGPQAGASVSNARTSDPAYLHTVPVSDLRPAATATTPATLGQVPGITPAATPEETPPAPQEQTDGTARDPHYPQVLAWARDTTAQVSYPEVRDRLGIDLDRATRLLQLARDQILVEKRAGTHAQVPGVPPAEGASLSGSQFTQLADALVERLRTGTHPTTMRELQNLAQEVYGGTRGEGAFSPKDLYDAMELALHTAVQHEHARTGAMDPRAPLPDALRDVQHLRDLLTGLPTHTVRTQEQDALQQFSTPLDYAYAAAWAANLQPGDRVLEPSAGTGALASMAANAVGRDHVQVNEIAPRRLEALRALGFTHVTSEDALYAHSLLTPQLAERPTTVLMNPPFSAAARQNRQNNLVGARHVEEALKLLPDGGRLVAIVGRGMSPTAATFQDWFQRIGGRNTIRANIGVSGEVYAKHGTSFATRLLIIDKGGSTPRGSTLVGEVETIPDLLRLLDQGGIRDARGTPAATPGGPEPAQPGGAPPAPAGAGTPQAGGESAGATDAVEPGERSRPAVRPPARPPGGDIADTGGLAGGGRTAVPDAESGRPGVSRPADTGGPEGPESPPGVAGTPEPASRPAPERGPAVPPAAAGEPERPVRDVTPPSPDVPTPVPETSGSPEAATADLTDAVFAPYQPQRLAIPGAQPHPGSLVQSTAMASVQPPAVTYQHALPQEIITEGRLSSAQLESVVGAGQAHSVVLPSIEGETPQRRGYFVGDGTGVGKGREIAGIIADNFAQGRTKAIWISEKAALLNDARRDWLGVTLPRGTNPASPEARQRAGEVTRLSGFDPPKQDKGILFTTYDTLRTSDKTDATRTHVAQLVNWLGKDFDGVLVFDEAHALGNNTSEQGAGRGRGREASKRALAGIELQNALPNARVVYVSATGATEVRNLGYLERLGLWGPKTAFADKQDFINKIGAGGVAAMEMVARDLKALGLYNARSLSYHDVRYDRVESPLTAEQRDAYDLMARGWQGVLQNIGQALQLTGGEGGLQRSNALSQFWSTHQRFFNQVLTAMQTPAMLRRMQADIERGDAVVVQIVNTNAAIQERRLASLTPQDDLEELSLTPLDTLMDYVRNSFPVQQMEEYADEHGNTRIRPLLDSTGQAVENPEAVALRDRTLDELALLANVVPDGPLELLMHQFGPDQVAEVTGRKERLVYRDDEQGVRRRVRESRTEAMTQADAQAFMDDKKRILIFSDKGGTGRSYHADLDAVNQRQRQHYILQAGWRADKAIQGLGRTHRTNQASAPEFHLVTTDLPGQKRFISSIARRLDQLGALTRGQRQASAQGLFSERDNLESPYAADALKQYFRDLHENRDVSLSLEEFERQTGLKLRNENGGLSSDLPAIPQFLNRLLSLTIDAQHSVFNDFSARLDQAIELAIQQGRFDVGMETLRADKIAKVRDDVVATDPESGAETRHVTLAVSTRRRTVPWEALQARAQALTTAQWLGYFENTQSGKLYAFMTALPSTDPSTGTMVERVRRLSVEGEELLEKRLLDPQRYRLVPADAARPRWDQQVSQVPEFHERTEHLMTGALLPHWDKLPQGTAKVYRLRTDSGETLLGRVIAPKDIDSTLKNFGQAPSGEAAPFALTPDAAQGRVLEQRDTLRLANNWRLKPSLVGGEQRIELTGVTPRYLDELVAEGVLYERIQYQPRFFIPGGARGVEVLRRLTETRPIVEAIPGRSESAGGVPGIPPAERPPGRLRVTTEPTGTQEAQGLFPPAATERPDATRDIVEASQAALEEAERPRTLTDVTGQSVPAVPPGAPGLPGLRVVARGIPTNETIDRLRQTGTVAFGGQRFQSHLELAQLAQVVRDSRIERLFWLPFTTEAGGGRRILSVRAVSARRAAASMAFPIEAGYAREQQYANFRTWLADLGADGYYLLHNHPTGDARPSPADIKLTRDLSSQVPGIAGHVVIDSGHYAHIAQDGGVTLHPLEGHPTIQPSLPPRDPLTGTYSAVTQYAPGDPFYEAALPHPALTTIDKVDDLVPLAKSLGTDPGWVSLFYIAGKQVRAIEQLSVQEFGEFFAQRHIQEQKNAYGGSVVVAVMPITGRRAGNAQAQRNATAMVDRGILHNFYTDTKGNVQHLAEVRQARQARGEKSPDTPYPTETHYVEAVQPLLQAEATPRTRPEDLENERQEPPEATPRAFRTFTPQTQLKSLLDYAHIAKVIDPAERGRLQEAAERGEFVFRQERIPDDQLGQEALAIRREWADDPAKRVRFLERLVGDVGAADRPGAASEPQARALRDEADELYQLMYAAQKQGVYTPEEFADFEGRWTQHNAMVQHATQAVSTFGRGLRDANNHGVALYQRVQEHLRTLEGTIPDADRQKLFALIRDALGTGDYDTLRRVATYAPPTTLNFLREMFYNSALSNPASLVKKGVSVLSHILFNDTVVQGLGGSIDRLVAPYANRDRQVYTESILPRLSAGFAPSRLGQAGREFWWVWTGKPEAASIDPMHFRHGFEEEALGNVGAATAWGRAQWNISVPALGIQAGQPIAAMRRLAPIMTAASRAFQAAGVALRHLAFDTTMAGEAREAALREFGSAERIPAGWEAQWTSQQIAASSGVVQRATARSAELTFQDPMSAFGRMLQSGSHLPQPLGLIWDMILPFKSTPDRLLQRGLELFPGTTAIPWALRNTEWAGWVPRFNPETAFKDPQVSLMLAKQLIGAAMVGGVAALWSQGLLTGAAPSNPAERDQFYRSGKVPFAIKAGNQWVSYDWFHPLNLPFATATAGIDAAARLLAKHEGDPEIPTNTAYDALALLSVSAQGMISHVIESSYFSGLASFLEGTTAGRESGGDIPRGVMRVLSTLITPYQGLQRGLIRSIDSLGIVPGTTPGQTLVRSPKTFPEMLAANSLLAYSPLGPEPRRDLFGQPQYSSTTPLEGLFSPARRHTAIDTDVEETFARLRYYPGPLAKTDEFGKPYDAETYQAITIRRGELLQPRIERRLLQPDWQRLTPDQQKDALRQLVSATGRQARAEVLRERRRTASAVP